MVSGLQSWSLRQDLLFFQQAQKSSTKALTVYLAKRPAGTKTKPVVIVPKHVAKLAISRHRLKRQIRAIIRQQTTFPHQVVVVVHRVGVTQTYQELANQIKQALTSFKDL